MTWYRDITSRDARPGLARSLLCNLADDSDIVVSSANEIRCMCTPVCGPSRDEQHAPR